MFEQGDRFVGPARSLASRIVLVALLAMAGCATSGPQPLEAMDRPIELERFMGDWYVIGFIPISIPFFSEEGAHNAVESYRLEDDGIIQTTYTFRDGGFDGPEQRFTPRGWVHEEDTNNTEWRMQFVWPFSAAYLIVHLDADYQRTIIGVPNRNNVWIMSRSPEMSDAEYALMLERAAAMGYATDQIQRVPHRWPAN